jgi:hypothetical protein
MEKTLIKLLLPPMLCPAKVKKMLIDKTISGMGLVRALVFLSIILIVMIMVTVREHTHCFMSVMDLLASGSARSLTIIVLRWRIRYCYWTDTI